jgi:hypothetical protein
MNVALLILFHSILQPTSRMNGRTSGVWFTLIWPTDTDNVDKKIDISAVPEKKGMLLYIDRKRTKDDKPREEYIYRMNMGIVDALKVGIPLSYVEIVMRKFIPAMDGPVDPGLLVQAQKKSREGAAAVLSNEDSV